MIPFESINYITLQIVIVVQRWNVKYQFTKKWHSSTDISTRPRCERHVQLLSFNLCMYWHDKLVTKWCKWFGFSCEKIGFCQIWLILISLSIEQGHTQFCKNLLILRFLIFMSFYMFKRELSNICDIVNGRGGGTLWMFLLILSEH